MSQPTDTSTALSLPRERLHALRAWLKQHGFDGVIVPRQDEFQGEYVSPYAERLRWLTGFSGSWGLAIVTLQRAAIFVDGRYTVQVRQQVDTKLFEPQHLITQPPAAWIKAHLPAGQRLAYDPWLMTMDEAARFRTACAAAKAELVPTDGNAIDAIWPGQPARPSSPIRLQPARLAGATAATKLAAIAEDLKTRKADAVLLCDPTSVAWALNIRASDIPHIPVALAYAIVHRSGMADVFASPARLAGDVQPALGKGVKFLAPDKLRAALELLGERKATVLADGASTPDAIATILTTAGAQVTASADPCMRPRAQKNATEQKGARAAQLRDGAALANFLCWLDTHPRPATLHEQDATDKLAAFRAQTGVLRDLSFTTISASGPNAALPHYHVDKGKGRKLRRNDIYLVDSGAQYDDGTTDVTRTIIIGKPSVEMKDRFTRVLQGMIAISVARFPEGTTGAHLDALARNALWQAGLDFDHGTGHGVGSYLSVHEGPARISKTGHHPLLPGMILSNEPGYYRQGHYGIRIENLLLVLPAKKLPGGERDMLSFETLTLAPIDRRLIEVKLLTRSELDWINAYHARVLAALAPLVDKVTRPWLKAACAPLR